MAQSPSPPRGPAGVLMAFVLVAVAVLVFAPNVLGGWIGGLIGQVWATALTAITALLSGLFGAP